MRFTPGTGQQPLLCPDRCSRPRGVSRSATPTDAPTSAKKRRAAEREEAVATSSASTTLLDHLRQHGVDNPSLADLQRKKMEADIKASSAHAKEASVRSDEAAARLESVEAEKWYMKKIFPQLSRIASAALDFDHIVKLPEGAHREAARLPKPRAFELARKAAALKKNKEAQDFLRSLATSWNDDFYSIPALTTLKTLTNVIELSKEE